MPPAETLPQSPPFSLLTAATLVLIVAASVCMYLMLVRRWTSRRQWVGLARWARESGFHLRRARRDVLPAPLAQLVHSDEQVLFHLADPRTTLVQFQTDPVQGGGAPPKWNVLIRKRPASGRVAGLRPGTQPVNLIDLLPLSRHPALALGDRFMVYAADTQVAHRLADSPAVALLPPDLALILLEEHIVLDFSNRPFDPIEFGRIGALTDQLSQVLA